MKSPQPLPDLSFRRASEYALHLPRNSRECENYRPSRLEADSGRRPHRVLERGRPQGESRHLPPRRGELQVAPPHLDVVVPDHPQGFPVECQPPVQPLRDPRKSHVVRGWPEPPHDDHQLWFAAERFPHGGGDFPEVVIDGRYTGQPRPHPGKPPPDPVGVRVDRLSNEQLPPDRKDLDPHPALNPL